MKACELKLGNASEFGFDDSKLTDADRGALNSLATCFTSGPLKDENMSIIGRADPRGTAQYNLALGQRRSSTVAAYLSHQGIDSHRIGATSRGSADATGTDEASWANDRRVDISIAR
jgi:peptidoglycan-associated lipoprotein